jgi:hypothetical protein
MVCAIAIEVGIWREFVDGGVASEGSACVVMDGEKGDVYNGRGEGKK